MVYKGVDFENFVQEARPKLDAAFVSAYGIEAGPEVAAETLTYAWEHWDRVSQMDNPTGYLFRVGQTAARKINKKEGLLPTSPERVPHFEPKLLPALTSLTELQRTAVLVVHAYHWSIPEAAELLEISDSSVRTHIARGLTKLRAALEVSQ